MFIVFIDIIIGFAFSNNPVVFLGYVTSAPGSRDYHVLLNQGRRKVRTIGKISMCWLFTLTMK